MIHAVAAAVGVVVFVLFLVNLDFGFLAALVWALVAAGAVLWLLLRRARPTDTASPAALPPQAPVRRDPVPAPSPAPRPEPTGAPPAGASRAETVPEAKAEAGTEAKAETAHPVVPAEDKPVVPVEDKPAVPAEDKPATDRRGETVGASAIVRPTARLAGQEDVSSFRGSWRYEGGDPAPRSAGKVPVRLDAPRGGAADDLKRIKGIGPKLERLCHSLGFYHFDQIAAWTEAEVAWVDDHLEGFRGRVSRDGWVEQARVLAAGGARDTDTGGLP